METAPTLQFLSGTCALGGSFGSRLLHGCGNGGVLKEGFPLSARVFDCIMCQAGGILARVAISSCLWLMPTTVVDRALDSPAAPFPPFASSSCWLRNVCSVSGSLTHLTVPLSWTYSLACDGCHSLFRVPPVSRRIAAAVQSQAVNLGLLF